MKRPKPISRRSCSKSALRARSSICTTRSRTSSPQGRRSSEIADKLKLNYEVVDQVDREGRKPDGSTVTLPAQKELLNAVFATDTGVENDPIDAKDEGVIWYEVLGVVPEQLKPFDQVKDEVAKDWRADEVRSQGRRNMRKTWSPA